MGDGYMPQPDRLDWGTPQAVFDYADSRWGRFDIDLAASHSNAKCARFITEEQNALECDWRGRIGWLNPPYGRMLKPFAFKIIEQVFEKKNIDRVVILVPSRTDTIWFNTLVEYASEIVFFKGRLKFEGASSSAPFSSVLMMFDRPSLPHKVEFGLVVR